MDTSNNLSKRNVGGKRVICHCTVLFPKGDVFSPTPVTKTGVLVFNVRGGSLYCYSQFDERTVKTIFPPDKPTTINQIILKPVDAPELTLNKYQARFLKFNYLSDCTGLIFRFSHHTEQQMDTLNSLTESLPPLMESEEIHVSALMKRTNKSKA